MPGLPVASRRRERLVIRARCGALGAIVAVLVLAVLRSTRVDPLGQFAMQLESILSKANGRTQEVTIANNNSSYYSRVGNDSQQRSSFHGTTADALDAPTRNIADTTTNSSTSTAPATNWTDYFQRFVHNMATHWDSSSSPPIPQIVGAPESNPFAFQNFSEAEQCKGSNDEAALRCMTPSFDVRTATFRTYERNDPRMRGILKFPRIDSNVRFHNRIAMLTNYLLGGALCNWLVEVPWGSIGTIRSTSFNCADFRDVLPRDNEATAAKCSKLARQRLSCHSWFRSSTLDPVVEGLHGDSILPGAILTARARNAYMGINVGRYDCGECPSTSTQATVVAYLRGEDVFNDNPNRGYGQPPLDYYVKSIEHAAQGRNAEVVVVSQDRKNPVLNAIEEHFRNNNSTANNIVVVVRIGEPFSAVLRRIYCAEAVILARSSMTMHVSTGINARNVYVPDPSITEGSYQGCRDSSSLRTTVSEIGTVHRRRVYVYERRGNYTVMDEEWMNTPTQRGEMLSFRNGSLVPAYLNLFWMGVSIGEKRVSLEARGQAGC